MTELVGGLGEAVEEEDCGFGGGGDGGLVEVGDAEGFGGVGEGEEGG